MGLIKEHRICVSMDPCKTLVIPLDPIASDPFDCSIPLNFQFLQKLATFGLVVIKSKHLIDEMHELAGYLGAVEQEDEVLATDHALQRQRLELTTGAVPWHTEHIYKDHIPSYVMLGCQELQANGGNTLLLDGEVAVRELLTRAPWAERVILSYSKDRFCGESPLIVRNPLTGLPTLRFRQNQPGLSSVSTLVSGPIGVTVESVNDLVNKLLRETQPTYSHAWEEGDILIVDNKRMLHAREEFSGQRILRRILIG